MLYRLFFILFLAFGSGCIIAHEKHVHKAQARYLANEGVMVEVGKYKILFDPFFHNNYGQYQLVPEQIIDAIMHNRAPYNNINMVFISHAHGDHFAAEDMLAYLTKFKHVKLVAPDQAIEQMSSLEGFKQVKSQIREISLEYQQAPISFRLDGINIDAVRIPHAGWPGRADVSNIVFRVSLQANEKGATSTYIHMGDADPNDDHFRPLIEFWQLKRTDLAFPPYWFFLSLQGNYILDERINANKSIGVHVPMSTPTALIKSGKPYFSQPGEVEKIEK